MSSPPKSISTGAFKSRCLGVIDEVMRTRQPVLVTKHGRPVAKVIPTETHGASVVHLLRAKATARNRSGEARRTPKTVDHAPGRFLDWLVLMRLIFLFP